MDGYYYLDIIILPRAGNMRTFTLSEFWRKVPEQVIFSKKNMCMLSRQIIVYVTSIEKQNNAMEFLPACIASRLT